MHWLLSLIPLYNLSLGLILLVLPGTNGDNQYGPDPLPAGASEGDRLLLIANRHELAGDWDQAFDAYKLPDEKQRGRPNGDYAIECIKRLHEKVSLDA